MAEPTPPRASRPPSPRDIALLRLDHAHLPGWPTGLTGRPPPEPASASDAAFAEVLYVGAVKRLLPLRWRLAHHAGRPLRAIDPLVQKILVLAAWQLTGLTHVPAAIAVDQAVEQTRRFGRAKAAGLVNAVLRNVLRQPPPELPAGTPLPERLELLWGIPRAVAARLSDELGPERAELLAAHADLTPPTILRLYSGRSVEDVARVLEAHPPPLPRVTPHMADGLVVVDGGRREHFAALAEAGIAQVQDPAAAAVVPDMDLAPGLRVLDRCCGNGTKTLQILDLLGPSGHIDATDPDGRRRDRLSALLARRGIGNVCVLPEPPPDAPPYDRVLLDVPCSNSAVLARRPEARFRQRESDLAPLQAVQQALLRDAAGCVKPGGLLVYSTCSLWRSENQQQVGRFLQSDGRFVLRMERLTLPACPDSDATRYTDGGYVAVMVRDR
ncbi:MAG: RsmB/NOP family class I SAM-dependent RNA methyltransferase [Tepidisphaerales bacterium]